MPEKIAQPRRQQPIAIDYAAVNNTAKKTNRPKRNSQNQRKKANNNKEATTMVQYEVIKKRTENMEVEDRMEETIYRKSNKNRPRSEHNHDRELPFSTSKTTNTGRKEPVQDGNGSPGQKTYSN